MSTRNHVAIMSRLRSLQVDYTERRGRSATGEHGGHNIAVSHFFLPSQMRCYPFLLTESQHWLSFGLASRSSERISVRSRISKKVITSTD